MQNIEIVYAAITAILVIALLLGRSKAQYAKGAKMAAVWLVILALVFGVVAYWDEFKGSKFYTALVPGEALHGEHSMEFTRAVDGHFHVNAMVDGVKIKFMVDTGAGDIMLTRKDAAKLGFDVGKLQFNKLYQTANGYTRGASVSLKNIEVGEFQTGAINASINEGELDTSLLGMAFLDRLKGYRVEGDRLIIQK